MTTRGARIAVLLAGLAACSGEAPPVSFSAPAPVRSVVAVDAGGVTPAAPAELTFAAAEEDPDSAKLAAAMATLAWTLTATADPSASVTSEDLAIRSSLEWLAGRCPEALRSIEESRKAAVVADPRIRAHLSYPTELACRAQLQGGAFDSAVASRLRQHLAGADDETANRALATFEPILSPDLRRNVVRALAGARDKPALERDEARSLALAYATYTLFRRLELAAETVRKEDCERRYVIKDVDIATPDGATISATVIRPRRATTPTTTALVFTIYASRLALRDPFRAAAHGYVGVIAFSRGKRSSPDPIVPYEKDGADAAAVIDWIARQPWSDGRVGMYGGSYNGFTQWAAARHHPHALKTIVPYVAAIPGYGLPMANNVPLTANYAWTFYVTDNRELDDEVYGDRERWRSLDEKWFASGRPYRDYEALDGTPNPFFQRALDHPSFDAYWQAMVPYGADFAAIDLPVLTVTGYYDDGQISALRYTREHVAHRPGAEHYVVIGPYDHFGAQRRPPAVIRGYALDAAARIDTTALTFAWMDHVFRGAPRPAILADKVNFEVMGANEWRHVPALEAMSGEKARYYFDGKSLATIRPAAPGVAHRQSVDFHDRKTWENAVYPDPIVQRDVDAGSGLRLVSEPLPAGTTVSGAFRGELRIRIDRRDVDLGVNLFELREDGSYVALGSWLGRASYAKDERRRQLLVPGRVATIPFRGSVVSERVQEGSRLVVLASVNKNMFAEVNYGTGKDVSRESIADAGKPLLVDWMSDSFIDVPMDRPAPSAP